MEISVSTRSVYILKVITQTIYIAVIYRTIKKGSSITAGTNLYIIMHDELWISVDSFSQAWWTFWECMPILTIDFKEIL